jgi:hypothetical protein
MPWVEFTSDFDWFVPRLRGRVLIAYRTGMRSLVSRDCAATAIAGGKARAIERRPDGEQSEPRTVSEID